MSVSPVYILGGYQTDFARNWSREGKTFVDLVRDTVQGALASAKVEARDVEAGHVGNFVGELFTGQGHLGGLFVEADPAFVGVATGRHEAACASGSIATLAATAEIEAGRYGLVCVLGVEWMRNVSGFEAQAKLGAAAWVPSETDGVRFPWPSMFSDVGDEYEKRYGLRDEHLRALGKNNFENARRNPNAQTRGWTLDEKSFGDDEEKNPRIAGRLRKHDCSQVSDGGAALLLASHAYAEKWARARGLALESVPRVLGWGQRTARMALRDKLRASEGERYVFPQVRGAIEDAFERAGLEGVRDVQCVETHDCFTTTQYMAIDHFGVTAPGESYKAIEDGTVQWGGALPFNPSGGLIGGGHPVGATGVRMLLDASKQVTGQAGAYQVGGAKRAATLNLGGSATTSVCFVVGAG